MLYISNKYTSLHSILCESEDTDEAYTVGAGFTLKDTVEKLYSIKALDSDQKKQLKSFATYMYKLWKVNYALDPEKIPFRFDDSGLKVVKISAEKEYKDIINSDIESGKLSISNKTKFGFTLGGITFAYGTGSLSGKTRSSSGTAYEDVVRDELVQLIQVASNSKSIKKIKDSIDESVYHLLPILQSGALNEVISMYRKNKDIDLYSIITKHEGSTHRNDHGEISDANCNLNTSDTESILRNSGKIIADVIVNTSKPVYISVKMKTGQLSSFNLMKVFENNTVFVDAINLRNSYDEIKTALNRTPFKNFCKVFGIDGKDLYNKFLNFAEGVDTNLNIKTTSSYAGNDLGTIIQKLVGGNYWYVKPDTDAVYLNYKDAGLSFKRSGVHFSAGDHRCILVDGSVSGVKITLKIRTALKAYTYPYRVLPEINVLDLIEVLAE